MNELKEIYYQTAIKNIWKIKEFQVLNNLRCLRQINQLEYDNKISESDTYTVSMRKIEDWDNFQMMMEVCDQVDKNMPAQAISQLLGIWEGDIISEMEKHLPGRHEATKK